MRHAPFLLALLLGTAPLAVVGDAHAQDAGLRGPLTDAPERDEAFAADEEETDDVTGRPRPPVFDDLPDAGRRDGDAADAADPTRATPARRPARPANADRRGLTGTQEGEERRVENNRRLDRAERAVRVGTRQTDGSISPLANPRLLTVQGGFRRTPPGPYEPLGVRLGPLRLSGTLEQGLGYTTNADFARDGSASAVSDTRVSLTAVTETDVNEFRATLRAGTQEFLNGDTPATPTVDAEAAYRYDLRRGTALTLGTTYAFSTEAASDDDITVPAGVELGDRPGVHRYSIYGEAERTGGRLFGRLRTTVAREEYEDAEFSDGSTLSQDDRDVTIFRTTLRLGYERTAAIRPFVEGELGYRLHDLRFDSAGFERDGTQYALRGGIALDFGARLSGEIAAGIEGFIYESERLEDVVGPSVTASLVWAPDALTTVTGTATTSLDAATDGGQAGALRYDAIVDVTRDVRDNLALTGLVGLGYEDFDGAREDLTWRAEVSALWRLNRTLGITGRLGYLNVDSSDDASSYDATTATIGLRLQR